MSSSWKKVVLTCTFLVGGLWGAASAHAAPDGAEVKVQVNDALVSFQEKQPRLDATLNLLVPLRDIADKIGARIDWSMNRDHIVVSLQNGAHTLQFTTGQSTMMVDGKTVLLKACPVFEDGHVLVPLRAVTDALQVRIQWDNHDRIAILDMDGKYHAPAWYAAPPAAASSTPAIASHVIQTASAFLGVPYVWGGTTPNGFDCSGLVQYVFDRLGIVLPRTSLQMYVDAGQSVDNPQPGDLVFFAKSGTTNHVGIYIGNDQFISATNSGVSVDHLSSDYWSHRYVGAKRVL